MTDTQVLRANAINRNASVGATPPHGPLKTGELPLVHVKTPPVGPPVQEGQQKPVQIMAPNSNGAVAVGALPMVKVKMSDGKPKPDNGVDERVLIRDSKHNAVAAGALPMIQVQMADGKPQIQTLPNVAGGPPQIPGAAPALSAPRPRPAQGYSANPNPGFVARPAGPVANQARVTRVAAPAVLPAPQVELPPVPDFSTDQLMLCRHVVDRFLGELVSADVPATTTDATTDATAAPAVEAADPSKAALVQLAEETLKTIDDILVATAMRAEAAAQAAAAAAAVPVAAPAPAALTIGAPAATSIAPAPSVAYSAGRVGGRSFVAGGQRAQRNSGMAPRRTGRPAAALPMVQVKMEGQKAVVQNKAEVDQAKAAAAVAAAEAPMEDDSLRVLGEQNINLTTENEALRRELEALRAAAPVPAPDAEG